MIAAQINGMKFNKDMKNLINYSIGYLEGIQQGKVQFFHKLGVSVIEILKEYIDANARINPEILQHVYEWSKVGSPEARLFDIDYTVSNLGLSFKSTFRQSTSIKQGSKEPFYNKARIMEDGIPVSIRPKTANVLAFEVDGQKVFTPNEVTVNNPGGSAAQGGFEKTFDSFFSMYFTQAFLQSSGILEYLKSPVLYKKNFNAGIKGGRSVGFNTGFRWIINAGIGRG